MHAVSPRTYAFDACALLAYLKAEAGGEIVRGLLSDANNTCLVHAINACEVYYHIWRKSDQGRADRALADLVADGLLIKSDTGVTLWKQAARHKVALSNPPALADCFCLAFAQQSQAELVTGDHDFDQVADRGIWPIRFIL